MNIKDKIKEWQESFKYEHCFTEDAKKEVDDELELVLFAIDNLTNLKSPMHNERDSLRIRSQASNYMLCDSEFLKMINGVK